MWSTHLSMLIRSVSKPADSAQASLLKTLLLVMANVCYDVVHLVFLAVIVHRRGIPELKASVGAKVPAAAEA